MNTFISPNSIIIRTIIGLFMLLPSLTIAGAQGELGGFDIDEESTVRALERSLVQSGSLLLEPGTMDFETGLNFSYTENKTPVFIDANGVTRIGQLTQKRSKVDIPFNIRVGLPYDSQVDISIPIQTINETFITAGNNLVFEDANQGLGIGDARITLSKTLLREKGALPDVIGRLTWDTDTGKKTDNNVLLSGAGFNEYRVGITTTKRQDPLVFSASASAQRTSKKDNLQRGNQYSVSLGTFLAASPKTSLQVSVNQTLVAKAKLNGKKIAGSNQTVGVLNIGASSVVSPKSVVSISTGIGLTTSAPDYTVSISMNTRLENPAKNLNAVEDYLLP